MNAATGLWFRLHPPPFVGCAVLTQPLFAPSPDAPWPTTLTPSIVGMMQPVRSATDLDALETYRAAVKRWPKDKITLRNRARVTSLSPSTQVLLRVRPSPNPLLGGGRLTRDLPATSV